jgi:hypothetical protein
LSLLKKNRRGKTQLVSKKGIARSVNKLSGSKILTCRGFAHRDTHRLVGEPAGLVVMAPAAPHATPDAAEKYLFIFPRFG